MSWLLGTLTADPYRYRGLGARSCPAGGVAVTLPHSDLLIGAHPADDAGVMWTMCTHQPNQPAHTPIDFGKFTWINLSEEMYERGSGLLYLPDGSTLTVVRRSGHGSDARYMIRSRVNPLRTVSGTESWADLPAVEQIAAQVHTALLAPADARGADAPP